VLDDRTSVGAGRKSARDQQHRAQQQHDKRAAGNREVPALGGETFARQRTGQRHDRHDHEEAAINIAKPIVVLSQGVLVFKPAKALPLLPFAEL